LWNYLSSEGQISALPGLLAAVVTRPLLSLVATVCLAHDAALDRAISRTEISKAIIVQFANTCFIDSWTARSDSFASLCAPAAC
jgi:hypothetical protein